MPNYSANAMGQKPQPPEALPVSQVPAEPKSIRDYLAISKGGARRFTNIPGQAGPGTHYMPEEQPQQAISGGPESDYERIPFSQRVAMSPYTRAKERVKTMLPDLWQEMFPGYQQGAILQESEMNKWNGAVQALTADLLKRFDKQYGASQKVMRETKKQRGEDQRYWQKFYHTQKQKGQPVIDQEGMPVSESDYVRERMSAADEIRVKDQLRKDESSQSSGVDQYSVKDIGAILKRNPDLKRQMLFQIKNYLEQTLGVLDEGRFRDAMSNPKYKEIRDEAIHDTMQQYKDEIEQAAGRSQEND